MISSISSVPIESLTKSGVTPVFACSSTVSCWWVVLAGWITRLFESPIFARSEKSFRAVDKLPARLLPSLDADADKRPETPVEVLLGQCMVRVVRQAGVVDPGDLRVAVEELCNGERVLRVTGDPQVERLKADQKQPRVKRADDGAGIPHERDPDLKDERNVPEAREVPERVPVLRGRGSRGRVR